MKRVYNFSAGPAMLPVSVLKKAQEEMLDYGGSGMSVMEMSHRGSVFAGILKEATELLREVMGVPSNYKILFLQGGASLQFAMVPVNLFRKSRKADFIHTGAWSKKAMAEAKKLGTVNVVASSEDKNFTYIPDWDDNAFSPDADYVHITTNNTIYGTRFTTFPSTGNVPLVADMSSNILSEAVDVSKFGIIYAGAQKNIGPAGVTVVVIREDLLGHAPEKTLSMLDYKIQADNDSCYNTPPCYSIYIAMMVFKWIKDQGGLAAVEKTNKEKAKLLYDYLDESAMFKSPVRPKDRSIMNVPFVTDSDELNAAFIKEAANRGLVTLKGHRSVGGMRASIYNAMPVEGVKKLIEVMKKFEHDNR
ncbi:MAG: 3-phosphoserine/phosphohydroxythreonine transaminase [Spirochaetales bacterium]|nr:3-phosphoserine/phosphohydroxythreonine transaminase [Spirochaetales bacterium]